MTTLAPCKQLTWCVPVVLCAAWLFGPSPAAGQTRPSDDLPEPIIQDPPAPPDESDAEFLDDPWAPLDRPRPGRPPHRRGPPDRLDRPRRADELARGLFRPLPMDMGPVRPSEEKELLEFAREHAPRLFSAIESLREGDPERFRRRLGEIAPRLRQLHRIHERTPKLADLVRQHSENMFESMRLAREARRFEPGTPAHDEVLGEIRNRMADVTRIECDALRVLADELDERRPERIAAWLKYFLDEAPEAADRAPSRLRGMIDAYRSTESEATRAELRARLATRVDELMRFETDNLRERAERRRQSMPDEVERRVERLLGGLPPDAPPLPEGRPRHGPGPRGPRLDGPPRPPPP